MLGVLAQMGWGQWLLAAALIAVCCVLMIVILLQRGRGSGLTGAFGGGGGSSAFGAKTGDVFTWITVVVAAVFLLGNVLGNYAFDQSPKEQSAEAPVEESAAPDEPGSNLPIKVTPVEVPPMPAGATAPGEGATTPAPAPSAETATPDTQPGGTPENEQPEGTGGEQDDSTP
ncbi:MAG: preprotein translocase subunit SecG [Phycisphaerae bacterium]|jgi:preprotein translocase subunit SecG